MRAVGYRVPSPITAEDSPVDIEMEEPTAGGRHLLVRVDAVSVNPVDYKVRRSTAPAGMDWAGSAAMPLTAMTAWEGLFDRLDVRRAVPGAEPAILVIGAGGGVGSIAVQLARQLTGLLVVGTASRAGTQAWVRQLGAHVVIDHSKPLAAEWRSLGLGPPAFVFSARHTQRHYEAIAEIVAPQGRIVFIDELTEFDFMALRRKSASPHHELMFTRAIFETPDMGEQGRLLNEVAELVDAGTLRTTLSEHGGPMTAANLKRAHETLESGTARGKIVLESFPA